MTWLTLPTLGSYGRLGNQLWQLAAGLGHAERNGAELRLLLWEYRSSFPGLEAAGATFHRELRPGGLWSEPEWTFRRLPPFWDGMGLHGYFQAPRYWPDKERIRRALLPVHAPDAPADLCTVHVRRGDYLNLTEHHPIPSRAWYDAAMVRAREAGAARFVICSDDPIWCVREWPEHQISELSEMWDLALMARCRFNILANSSLSWWGAFLGGPGRAVIAPAQWFGPALATHDRAQLDPGEGWVWV